MNKLAFVLGSVFLISLGACHLDKKEDTTTRVRPVTTTPTTTTTKKVDLIWSGSVEFTNTDKYKNLLRGQGRCDPCTHYTGPLECKNFTNQAEVELKLDKNDDFPAKATLNLYPHHKNKGKILNLFAFAGACRKSSVLPETVITYKGTVKWAYEYEGFYIRFESINESGSISYLIMDSSDTDPTRHDFLNVSLYYGGSATSGSEFGTANLESSDPEGAGVESSYETSRGR